MSCRLHASFCSNEELLTTAKSAPSCKTMRFKPIKSVSAVRSRRCRPHAGPRLIITESIDK